DAVFVGEVLPVGDFSADDHLARSAGDDVKIVGAGVLLGVIPNAAYFGKALHGLFAVETIELKNAEIASGNMDRAAAEGLRSSRACLLHRLRGFFGKTQVGFVEIVGAPERSRRRIGRERRFARRVEAEGHHFGLLVLRGRRRHKGKLLWRTSLAQAWRRFRR